jgi:hypothetical protein
MFARAQCALLLKKIAFYPANLCVLHNSSNKQLLFSYTALSSEGAEIAISLR